MTQDRTAYWGESESAARYQTGDDDAAGGDFIVARDLDGQRMLLKFDFTADEWQYAGDVDIGGGDLNSVGTAQVDALEAESVSTEDANITGSFSFQFGTGEDKEENRELETTYQNTTENLIQVVVVLEADDDRIFYDAFVSPNSDPVEGISRVHETDLRNLESGETDSCSFLVPDGQYYHIRKRSSDDLTISDWNEKEAREP